MKNSFLTAPADLAFADVTLSFPLDAASGRLGLQMFPTALADRVAARRTRVDGAAPGPVVDALVQVKRLRDPYTPGFAQGHTMHASPSTDAFRFARQDVVRDGEKTTVTTVLRDEAHAHRIEHRLSWHEGDLGVEVATAFFNESDAPVTLEMLASFTLGGITPFDAADAPGRLRVHRFRSNWSAEGRLETRSVEELHLERSWQDAVVFSERFGQVGTMPVRKWFPFVAIEDVEAGVCWGAQLAWAGSWQMEVFRQSDEVCLSGGLADREFGHWTKTLAPGGSLISPPAFVSCVRGTLDDLCDRLTALQTRAADAQPAVEHDLPIVFNEWCTTWGDPQHDKVVAIADRLQGTEVRYLVIDAGWYKQDGTDWSSGHGDWEPSATLFPHGLEDTAAAIRERGLTPGLWYEMETVGSQSAAFLKTDHLLQRDGVPVTVRERRFWNLCDPWAFAYLTEKVIDRLERGGFGYLKVDYNETLGLGSEHADGLGEGLRQQVLATYRFFETIRERLPDLVIENCASGGHRLEPSMLGRTAMSSFSDAHETVEIPIIAANLHRLMLPRQSQIWAVLRRADSMQRLAYSLAATFLGRMCLSGEIAELSEEQWTLVRRAMALYRRAAPIIKHGRSRLVREMGESWRHPRGWQVVLRTHVSGQETLVVAHAFAEPAKTPEIELPPGGAWRIEEQFPDDGSLTTAGGVLRWNAPAAFSGAVALLRRG